MIRPSTIAVQAVFLAGILSLLIVAFNQPVQTQKLYHGRAFVPLPEQSQIYAQGSGTLQRIAIQEGMEIRAGETFMTLSNPGLEEQLEKARQMLLQKWARLESRYAILQERAPQWHRLGRFSDETLARFRRIHRVELGRQEERVNQVVLDQRALMYRLEEGREKVLDLEARLEKLKSEIATISAGKSGKTGARKEAALFFRKRVLRGMTSDLRDARSELAKLKKERRKFGRGDVPGKNAVTLLISRQIEKAQNAVDNATKHWWRLQREVGHLTVRAPFNARVDKIFKAQIGESIVAQESLVRLKPTLPNQVRVNLPKDEDYDYAPGEQVMVDLYHGSTGRRLGRQKAVVMERDALAMTVAFSDQTVGKRIQGQGKLLIGIHETKKRKLKTALFRPIGNNQFFFLL